MKNACEKRKEKKEKKEIKTPVFALIIGAINIFKILLIKNTTVRSIRK